MEQPGLFHRLDCCFWVVPALIQESELVVSRIPFHLERLALLAVYDGDDHDGSCNRVLAKVSVADADGSALPGLQGDFLRHLEHRVVGPAPKLYGHRLVGIVGQLELIGMALPRTEVGKRQYLLTHVEALPIVVRVVLCYGMGHGHYIGLDPYALIVLSIIEKDYYLLDEVARLVVGVELHFNVGSLTRPHAFLRKGRHDAAAPGVDIADSHHLPARIREGEDRAHLAVLLVDTAEVVGMLVRLELFQENGLPGAVLCGYGCKL